jgi:hypothetical protein
MAWFTFTDASGGTFLVRLTDPSQSAHARGLIAGTEVDDARIAGTVVKTAVPYNIGWSYHLQDIFFFEVSAEVGDSTMRYIESHLNQVGGALLPGSVWTPWSSVLTGELSPSSGGSGSDALEGSGAADILFGRAGDDTLLALAGNDYLIGQAGLDSLFGGDGDDKLDGGSGADELRGSGGEDYLVGGRGADRISAGNDNARDLIAYGSAEELSSTDKIFQFDFKDDASELLWDRIDLRRIDADVPRGGNQAFRFVESFETAGTGEPAGQVRALNQGADTRVEIDFNGDSATDAFIIVLGVALLTEADFLL